MTIDQREREDLQNRIQELGRDGRKVDDAAKETMDHLQKGNLQHSCDVVSLAWYKIQRQETEWQSLMAAFNKLGIQPGKGRKPD